MIKIILLIQILMLSHLIIKFEPITWLFELITPFFSKNTILTLLYNILLLSTSCLKCCSFWIGCILGGFWIGVTSFTIAYLYTNLLMPYIDKIRFQ